MAKAACTVNLRFADGVEHKIDVDHGEFILDTAIAQSVPVLYQCRSGSCGTCVARLTEGEAIVPSGRSTSLLVSEREAGLRLTCCTVAHSDCTLEFAYDSKAGSSTAVTAHAFIDKIERIASDVVRLELELADGDWLEFQPGQFIQIKVPGTEFVRRYSMSSAPAAAPKLELLIRLLADGVMSDYLLNRARVDDALEIEGPYGSFFSARPWPRKARHGRRRYGPRADDVDA